MRTMKRVLVITALSAVAVAGVGVGAAAAAGGSGNSLCSNNGNPNAAPYVNVGSMIREHLPFGGSGNDGSNPGFAGPGASPACSPADG